MNQRFSSYHTQNYEVDLIKALIFLICLVVSVILPTAPIMASDQDIDSLKVWLPGSYSSQKQHEINEEYAHVVMQIVRLPQLNESKTALWFYVQQAMIQDTLSPYFQRVLLVQRVEEGMIEFQVFEIKEGSTKYRIASNLELLNMISVKDLERKTGCELYFQVSDDGFIGGTHGTACRSKENSQMWIKSEITIRADGMRIWDRGFDATYSMVWGTDDGGYVFLK